MKTLAFALVVLLLVGRAAPADSGSPLADAAEKKAHATVAALLEKGVVASDVGISGRRKPHGLAIIALDAGVPDAVVLPRVHLASSGSSGAVVETAGRHLPGHICRQNGETSKGEQASKQGIHDHIP